jgi:hypothetical protein
LEILELKKIVFAALMAVLYPATAEIWVHASREEMRNFNTADAGDFYIDLDYVKFDGKWTSIRQKTVYDKASTYDHGKIVVEVLAYSCREFKYANRDRKDYASQDDKKPIQRIIKKSEWDKFSVGSIWPIVQSAEDSPEAHWYRFACMGYTPDDWATFKQHRDQKPQPVKNEESSKNYEIPDWLKKDQPQ